MDCNMPIMDGLESTRIIKKLNFFSDEKPIIIALTANSNESMKYKCTNNGMDGYMTKPLTSDKLTRVLQENNMI